MQTFLNIKKGFVKLRVVKLTKDNKITCGHQYPKDVY